MKKLVCLLLVVACLSGCADRKTINGVTYDTYGLFNQNEVKNDKIKYKISIGNVVWSIILVETIIAPIYFIGFDLYEPVRAITPTEVKGQV